MDGIWYLIIGVFIGGIGTMVLMSVMTAASNADDEMLAERQYYEGE